MSRTPFSTQNDPRRLTSENQPCGREELIIVSNRN